ncbi:MFA2 [Nakaseomyces glabratus]|uniref:Uncharacterized protein n=1 Tax=Candida glabrata (strain ATCC 2001 / BCRC 20586 / JCM 3761 / NBRC 0622 / NRRL Y-65 / CBS 138) TaxID=284593 RepID=B4UMY2_CANGA|nr:uncharacterized protein CAGL0C01919g [Nakaseomyces glabratus]KAH7590113.1 Mating hormone A-factor 1&2 [Nakaseomyces glabratus]KAH7591136.1 Mating hormone A-factor 1&2 [Nakaseomyces glabratus]KAH7597392.1 Mating hormone A-factor 1&2 [Nakaseomyces glabratus]KAH7607813.1 Mating hormone A-factor 1&2 [Nakaseomyces glabratus]KAH7608596.1 Mating hormone A-factor 1&2 [Nakaseomyces glabratus]|eukprot:XP_002999523.1 uncharacterized protein CAGL0C01919g [[Candida] glabrata]
MQPTIEATQKDNTQEKRDNYIVKGFFWSPDCVIA